MTLPNGLAEVRALYGDIVVQNGQIVGPPHWESQNMVMIPAGVLPGWSGRLYTNKAMVDPLTRALTRCVALGDGYAVKTLGSFAPRLKRGLNAPSLHSWGIAVDINADDNPLQRGVPTAQLQKTIPDTWVAIFEEEGFYWGGRFGDPMHFQIATGC